MSRLFLLTAWMWRKLARPPAGTGELRSWLEMKQRRPGIPSAGPALRKGRPGFAWKTAARVCLTVFPIVLGMSLPATADVSNIAKVTYNGGVEIFSNEVVDSSSGLVDCALEKTVDNPQPMEGDNLVYQITATNNSDKTVTGVTITDDFPAGLTYISSSQPCTSLADDRIVWSIGEMAPGQSLAVTLVVRVDAENGNAGQTITNTAEVTLNQTDTVPENNTATVDITVRTPPTIAFLQYAPAVSGADTLNVAPGAYSPGGSLTGPFTPLADPEALQYQPSIDLANPVPLTSAAFYHQGETIFVQVTDRDRNLDPGTAETVAVLLSSDLASVNDQEVILLTETGPGTGVFTGYIMSVSGEGISPYNGRLSVAANANITVRYHDTEDGANAAVFSTAMVDPGGIVFDSATGRPVDGAVITIVDSDGEPAEVYGNDGVSSYPSTVTSGDSAMDSSGTQYQFPPGGFRFPFIRTGNYQFRIAPPSGYTVPSTIATPVLQSLPGGPFVIVEGSRGEAFWVNPGPAIHIDIPMDPISNSLYLTKTANKDVAAVGDFVSYTLTVENTSASRITGVTLSDDLPLGFRYEKGSTIRDGVEMADPVQSDDGRILSFPVGIMGPEEFLTFTYVVEIAAGTRLGKAVNTAVALGDNAASRPASATVEVKEDLFRSHSFIVGRVITDNCGDEPIEENDGVAGVKIFLEDGTFAVTDKKGMYHFEGVNPGAHVVQLDLDSLPEKYEAVLCDENTRFARTPHSQFVDMQGGTMWRADFHVSLKPPPDGRVIMHLNSRRVMNTIFYDVHLAGEVVPLRNVRLTLLLPDSVTYVNGSSRMAGMPLSPEVRAGALTYRLGDVPGQWEKRLTLEAKMTAAATGGEITQLITKGLLTFDSPARNNQRTPVTENSLPINFEGEITRRAKHIPVFDSFSDALSDYGREQLGRVLKQLTDHRIKHIYVTGHTDNVPIRPRSRNIYPDNYELSRGRARSVAAYLQKMLDLPAAVITVDGRGPDEPVATNRTPEGRAKNRRVAIDIQSEALSYKAVLSDDRKEVTTQGFYPGEGWKSLDHGYSPPEEPPSATMPEINAAYVSSLTANDERVEWLWPQEGYNPAVPSTRIAIKHQPQVVPELFLNGIKVSPLNFEGTVTSNDGAVAVSTWRGVDLREGDNRFEAIMTVADGMEAVRLKRNLHFSHPPARATLVPEKSRLIADGETAPLLAIRLTDIDDHPVRRGIVGQYTISPPYTPLDKTDKIQGAPLTGTLDDPPAYTVTADGMIYVPLAPTARTGKARLEFAFVTGRQAVEAWLVADDREWILVGLAEGTVGYNTLSGHKENLDDTDVDDEIYEDGRIAFFAKGKIKGEWLLTLAADTTKEKAAGEESLFRTIDPDTYYTLYGDVVEQGYEAPSREKIYVKLEKNAFYALFGDYNTDLNIAELTRYNRSATGFKSEFENDTYSYSFFANESDQAFVKDEIRGNGTSGLYYLSRKDIVINSEKIILETRDRFKSEKILLSRPLTRHVDYNIDYDTGAIYFKEPIYSRNEGLNPIYIVADYETEDTGSDKAVNYGGRAAVKLMKGRLKVGATHIHEGTEGAEGDLVGADAAFELTDRTHLRAEIATSERESGVEALDGDAFLAEVTHYSDRLTGKLYIREQQAGFGLGQQNGTENGTRKVGGEAAYKISERMDATGQAYRQYNLATDAERNLAEITTGYNTGRTSYRAGLRHAQDNFDDGTSNRSNQLLVGAGTRTLEDRLALRVDHEQALNAGNNASADFPTRTILGADYELTHKTALFAEQEFTAGEFEDTRSTRIGLKTTPWSGGTVNSIVNRKYNENGARIYANMGLAQRWQLNEKWRLSGGLDHSRTIKDPGNRSVNINVDPASGTADDNDFTAVSLGAGYTEEQWCWDGRTEFRHSDRDDKYGLLTGLYGEPGNGLGLSGHLTLFRTAAVSGVETTQTDLRLGLVHRPRNTRWIIMDRLDLIYEDETGGGTDVKSRRIVNNLHVNYKPNFKTQIAFQYGAKYVLDTINSRSYSGYTDLTGLEARRDITARFDLGLYAGVLHSWNSDQYDYRTGVSVGCDIVKNFWLSLGYNFTGFTDRDFSEADFTAQGPFIKFRIKFDQQTAREAVALLTGIEVK